MRGVYLVIRHMLCTWSRSCHETCCDVRISGLETCAGSISCHEECVTCGVGWVVGGSGYILS